MKRMSNKNSPPTTMHTTVVYTHIEIEVVYSKRDTVESREVKEIASYSYSRFFFFFFSVSECLQLTAQQPRFELTTHDPVSVGGVPEWADAEMYDEMKMHKRASAAATSTECKEPSHHLRTYVYANISLYQRISVNCRRSFRLQNGRGGETFFFFFPFKRAQPEEEETGQHSDASCEGLAGAAWHCLWQQ